MRIWRNKFFTTDINSPSLASWYTIPLSLTSTINFQLWDPLDILPPFPNFRSSCPITENIQVVRLFAPGFRPCCPLKEIFQVVRFFPSFSLFLYHKNPHGTLRKFKFMQVHVGFRTKIWSKQLGMSLLHCTWNLFWFSEHVHVHYLILSLFMLSQLLATF